MSEQEVEEFLETVEKGLLESQQAMLREKALHDQCVVVADGHGGILRMSAREVLRQHPELRMP